MEDETMSGEGWLKLWRKTLESDVWGMSYRTRCVFFWLLMSVNYETGELTTTYRKIAAAITPENESCPSVKQIRTSILGLERAGVVSKIGHTEGQAFLHLKVSNWSHYQGNGIPVKADQGAGEGQALVSERAPIIRSKNGTVLTTNTVITTATRDVAEVFAYWQQVMGRTKCKLGPDRRGKVEARLREGYSVADIKKAIDGCALSPWHMGDNPRGKKYNDLVKICEKSSVLEGFMEDAETPASPLDRLFKDIEL